MNDEAFDITCFFCSKTYSWKDAMFLNKLMVVAPNGDNVILSIKVSTVKKGRCQEQNQKCCDDCLEQFVIKGVSE